MRVLVACEESQRVCISFRLRGHEAFSCDIQECSGGFPEWHIQSDVTELLQQEWDLIIAHPPCTYLSNVGAVHLYQSKGLINNKRFKKGLIGKEFFMLFYNSRCPKVCIENPIPTRIFGLPEYDQIIQPYNFGHPYKKKTCLWLKGLPKLEPTNVFTGKTQSWVSSSYGGLTSGAYMRSKTFIGIARAMAQQWG